MLHYILQLVFFQLCFLLAYELLLKKETFFNYNRWYLLLTPVLALLLPLLKLEFLAEAVPANTRIMLPAVVIGEQTGTMEPLPGAVSTEEGLIINWWLVIYSVGIAASFGLFLKKAYNLNRLFGFRKTSEEKDFRIIEIPNSNIACTFFNTIFLGDQLSEEEKRQVLSHELVHVKQKHSLDLMFFELLKIVFWFNPLIYIYQSRIAGLHEFIADQEVVKTTGKKTYYEQLLNTAFNTQKISFINQFFNHSLIKKRIVMLQKSKSTAIAKFKFLVIIPLMTLMLTYVACSEDSAQKKNDKEFLDQYEYTLTGSEMTPEVRAIHEKYEAFLRSNPDYVGWATRNYNTGEITYTVHSKDEKVPEGYTEWEVQFPDDGGRYTFFMNSKTDSKNSEEIKPEPVVNLFPESKEISFGDIDEAPAFPGCEEIASKEEIKECTSNKISQFVNRNFDPDLGKKLGLTGIHRMTVQFKIDKNGKIQEVKSRAPAPELEEEAKRVINSLPAMTPGKQNGEPVGVMYSLPIIFQVSE